MVSATAASLTEAAQPPAYGSEDSLPDGWDLVRDSGIPPLHQSKLSDDPSLRAEFIAGAQVMGVHGRGKSLKPQQLRLADVLNAGETETGVLMSRRTAKTTSLFAWLIGRCVSRDGYRAAYTQCTTGAKARERFRKDVIQVLERMWPDAQGGKWRIFKTNGAERIEFANGSLLQVMGPESEAFRGDTWDVVVLDESGEAGADMSDDLMQGILPTFDTQPDAQLVIAGTAAKFRDGNLLWMALAEGRRGEAGILEYAAPDSTDETRMGEWDYVAALVRSAHPGIDTLTTIEVAHRRWQKLSPRQFAEEYLSIFGTVGAAEAFVDLEAWQDEARKGDLPDPPTDRAVGLAAAVHPDQSCAVIMAAWRDDAGRACILVVDYRASTKWIAKRAKELAAKLRTPVVYDNAGTVLVEVEVMQRMRPRPRLDPQTWGNVSTAAGLFMKENAERNIVHWDQDELNTAVRLATKRGTATSSRWAFGRRDAGDSIIALEAGSLALRWVDEHPKRTNLRPSTRL
ncbi:phage terminase large subunit-like protein [Curtobacterium sp. PhB25]|nr:phage terminase large subunit-like protein [Curtobacterium sp. PhB25]